MPLCEALILRCLGLREGGGADLAAIAQLHPGKPVFAKLRDDFLSIVKGKPGRRFIDHYERHRQSAKKNEAAWKTTAVVMAGLILLLAGLLLSLPPGIPGFLLWLPGLALLVARLRAFAVAMDRAELFLRRALSRLSA